MSKENLVEETVETPATETAETKAVGAPVSTPDDVISGMLPDERISRSKALNIVRGQDIKCSQERMTKIMEVKYGAAPTKEEREAAQAEKKEAKAKEAAEKKAEREKARADKKAEREKLAQEARDKKAADKKAKEDAAKTDTAGTEAPSV